MGDEVKNYVIKMMKSTLDWSVTQEYKIYLLPPETEEKTTSRNELLMLQKHQESIHTNCVVWAV